jgi:hypothetical protein
MSFEEFSIILLIYMNENYATFNKVYAKMQKFEINFEFEFPFKIVIEFSDK